MKKRIGNDLQVEITVTRNGVAEDFSTLSSLHVLIKTCYGAIVPFEYSVSENVITGVFYGKNQMETGDYLIELCENAGKNSMTTIDAALVTLVPLTSMEDADDDNGLAVTMNIVPGEASVATTTSVVRNGLSAYELAVIDGFEGSCTEWLASLKGAKGDKGDKGDTGATGAQGPQGPAGQAADESNLVHKTGTEVITGYKSFVEGLNLRYATDSDINVYANDATTIIFEDSISADPVKLRNIAAPVNDSDVVNKGYLSTALASKQDKLIPGSGITIAADGKTISASGGASGAASWGGITGTLANQTDLATALSSKADSSSLGNLTDLATTAKSSAVAAINEVQQGKQEKSLIVTFTKDGSTYTADHTYAEIMTAINEGKEVSARYGGKILPLMDDGLIVSNKVTFQALYNLSTIFLAISSSDEITYASTSMEANRYRVRSTSPWVSTDYNYPATAAVDARFVPKEMPLLADITTQDGSVNIETIVLPSACRKLRFVMSGIYSPSGTAFTALLQVRTVGSSSVWNKPIYINVAANTNTEEMSHFMVVDFEVNNGIGMFTGIGGRTDVGYNLYGVSNVAPIAVEKVSEIRLTKNRADVQPFRILIYGY